MRNNHSIYTIKVPVKFQSNYAYKNIFYLIGPRPNRDWHYNVDPPFLFNGYIAVQGGGDGKVPETCKPKYRFGFLLKFTQTLTSTVRIHLSNKPNIYITTQI